MLEGQGTSGGMKSRHVCGARHAPARWHEVGDVGDVHAHAPPPRATLHRLHMHRIVQVLGCGRIYGKHARAPEYRLRSRQSKCASVICRTCACSWGQVPQQAQRHARKRLLTCSTPSGALGVAAQPSIAPSQWQAPHYYRGALLHSVQNLCCPHKATYFRQGWRAG